MRPKETAPATETQMNAALQERFDEALEEGKGDVQRALEAMIHYAKRLPYPKKRSEDAPNSKIQAMQLVRRELQRQRITQETYDALIGLLTDGKIDPAEKRRRNSERNVRTKAPGRAAGSISPGTAERRGWEHVENE